MSDGTLIARLRGGRDVEIHSCCCSRCRNEWYVPALSDEWMPSFCPYCGMKFSVQDTDGEFGDFTPHDPIQDVVEQRDEAESAADEMASLILGEPIDWPFHDEAWERAIQHLKGGEADGAFLP